MTEDIKRRMHYWPQPLRDEFEERAAIREYDGNVSREQAELGAYRELASGRKTGETKTQ